MSEPFDIRAMDYLVYLLVMCFIKGLGLLPRRLSLVVTQSIATLFYYLDSYHRKIMMKNLELAFPNLSTSQKRTIALEAFRNLGRIATELGYFPRINQTNVNRLVGFNPVDGIENLRKALSKGKGVLFLTGHVGIWELLPLASALFGYPLTFVIRPLDNKYLDRLLTHYRSLHGNTPLPKKNATREILQCLKKGGSVGILIDQNAHPPEGVFVNFFGTEACTTTGLAVLALRTGAAVVPAFLVKNDNGETYQIICEGEIELIRTGDMDRDIVENTQLFTNVIERIIRKYPGQWLWGHRRWKTRPAGNLERIY